MSQFTVSNDDQDDIVWITRYFEYHVEKEERHSLIKLQA